MQIFKKQKQKYSVSLTELLADSAVKNDLSIPRYISTDEGEVIRTPQNVALEAFKLLDGAFRIKEYGQQKELIMCYNLIKADSEEAVMFGSPLAAYLLAVINYNGYGVKKDLIKTKLWLLIGSELPGDNMCSPVVKNNNDVMDLLHGYSATKESYSKLRPIAQKYCKAISQMQQEYPYTDPITTYAITLGEKIFNEADPEHHLTVSGSVAEEESNSSIVDCCVVM